MNSFLNIEQINPFQKNKWGNGFPKERAKMSVLDTERELKKTFTWLDIGGIKKRLG